MPAATSSSVDRLGDYELLHELKSGGMGSVFLARKRAKGGFEKLLAIKTIRAELSSRSELRTMFLDEARLLARLEHPAVAQVYDFGEQDETLFLAMEYVPGVRFSDLAEAGTPPALALRLVADVCRALHAAHQLRDLEGQALEIVHRDVSPDNLMLSFDGHVKVLDFGIALMRGRQSPVTEYGTIKGKPPYLSPEQVRGQRVDRRADIWSTGVVLWELLAGRHLFRGDSIYTVALAIEEHEIQAPSVFAGELPEGLDAIVLRALARKVEDRYQSAQDMADDLLAIASSISAPSTVDFAGAALRPQREEHRAWLRDVLGGKNKSVPAGRATGMLTIPAQAVDFENPARASAAGVQKGGMAAAAGEDTTPATLAHAKLGRSRMALIVLVLAVLGAGTWFAVGRDAMRPRVAGADMDASSAIAAVVGSDAQTFAEADAAIVVDDAGPASDARRRRTAGMRVKPSPPVKDPEVPVKDLKVPVKDPARAPPAEKGFGTMTIAAEPFALVRVDGKEIGSTPFFKKKFPAGSHLVELIHPDTGKVRLRKSVDLAVDGHQNVIDR